MPDINDVYRKFGKVAEVVQLLESQLGDWLLFEMCMRDDLPSDSDFILTPKMYEKVDRQTIGQLLKELKNRSNPLKNLDADFRKALDERNRLFHRFYLEHDSRRNSSEGCQIMLDDLEELHETILDAYIKLLQESGIDLSDANLQNRSKILPTEHLNIYQRLSDLSDQVS